MIFLKKIPQKSSWKIIRVSPMKSEKNWNIFSSIFFVQDVAWDIQKCMLEVFLKNLYTILNALYPSVLEFKPPAPFFKKIFHKKNFLALKCRKFWLLQKFEVRSKMFEFGFISRAKCSECSKFDLPKFGKFEVRFCDVRSKTSIFFVQNLSGLKSPLNKFCTLSKWISSQYKLEEQWTSQNMNFQQKIFISMLLKK